MADGTTTRYVSPDLRVEGERTLYWSQRFPPAGQLLLPAALGVLLFLLYRLIRIPEARRDARICAGIIVAARVALLAFVLIMAGGIYCNPADEPGYFAVGYDVLHGKFAGPWTYPVGHGVLMMMPSARSMPSWVLFQRRMAWDTQGVAVYLPSLETRVLT